MAFDPTCTGRAAGPVEQRYDWRDTALYALGLGAGTADLSYLLDEPPPRVLPTYGVIPAFPLVFELLRGTGGDLVTLLHSAQRTELRRPFPPAGLMSTAARIGGAWDMKIGALVRIETETAVDGVPTARTAWQLLLRGAGGFGGERPPALLRTRPPAERPADFAVEVSTRPEQALLYRLCGDINPIHARPEVARAAGFERPILHGLCTYGVAGRAALRELAGDDPARFTALEARFAKVVLPGDTLVVEGWRLDEPGRAALTVRVKDRGEAAIASCLFEYRP
jgi:acyl dehydratase